MRKYLPKTAAVVLMALGIAIIGGSVVGGIVFAADRGSGQRTVVDDSPRTTGFDENADSSVDGNGRDSAEGRDTDEGSTSDDQGSDSDEDRGSSASSRTEDDAGDSRKAHPTPTAARDDDAEDHHPDHDD
jgi:hypothetical protein